MFFLFRLNSSWFTSRPSTTLSPALECAKAFHHLFPHSHQENTGHYCDPSPTPFDYTHFSVSQCTANMAPGITFMNLFSPRIHRKMPHRMQDKSQQPVREINNDSSHDKPFSSHQYITLEREVLSKLIFPNLISLCTFVTLLHNVENFTRKFLGSGFRDTIPPPRERKSNGKILQVTPPHSHSLPQLRVFHSSFLHTSHSLAIAVGQCCAAGATPYSAVVPIRPSVFAVAAFGVHPILTRPDRRRIAVGHESARNALSLSVRKRT